MCRQTHGSGAENMKMQNNSTVLNTERKYHFDLQKPFTTSDAQVEIFIKTYMRKWIRDRLENICSALAKYFLIIWMTCTTQITGGLFGGL